MKKLDCDNRAHTRKIAEIRLNKVPIFYLVKEKVWIFTTPLNMFYITESCN